MLWVAAMRERGERERNAGGEKEEEWNSTTYFFHRFAIQTRVMRQGESQLSPTIRGTSYNSPYIVPAQIKLV